jgi:EAL domain-containing protein (putative c-di-GMP-specific phosphodiesterase class I)
VSSSNDAGHVLDALRGLKDSGVRITLDDFWTGRSSLSYLLRLPFDKIKIGRSFIQAQTADQGAKAILDAIMLMGSRLGLEVVAEGVETEQLGMVRRQHCTGVQGVPVGQANARLRGPRLYPRPRGRASAA